MDLFMSKKKEDNNININMKKEKNNDESMILLNIVNMAVIEGNDTLISDE